MSELTGKQIVLGISGGIAAYKAPEIVRRLRDRGAVVRVAMTPAATAFITPLTLQAVSGFLVAESVLDPLQKRQWVILSWGNGRISLFSRPPRLT